MDMEFYWECRKRDEMAYYLNKLCITAGIWI